MELLVAVETELNSPASLSYIRNGTVRIANIIMMLAIAYSS